MPFLGVLPERRHLFQPEPVSDIAVSDAEAWRLNPAHRRVYDKLSVALDQGLRAAPCGVSPMSLGIEPDQPVFVKPIVNLAGMSLNARAKRADRVPAEPGSFWCELIEGQQSSTDCLVRDGRVLWRAHTLASPERDASRPIWWQIGVDSTGTDAVADAWVRHHLANYTGLCNLELIGDTVIEAHLRGSNGFFDFYGRDFFAAWVDLIDHGHWTDPGPIPGGSVVSMFGEGELPVSADAIAARYAVDIRPDRHGPGRIAIIRATSVDRSGLTRNRLDAALQALAALRDADR